MFKPHICWDMGLCNSMTAFIWNLELERAMRKTMRKTMRKSEGFVFLVQNE